MKIDEFLPITGFIHRLRASRLSPFDSPWNFTKKLWSNFSPCSICKTRGRSSFYLIPPNSVFICEINLFFSAFSADLLFDSLFKRSKWGQTNILYSTFRTRDRSSLYLIPSRYLFHRKMTFKALDRRGRGANFWFFWFIYCCLIYGWNLPRNRLVKVQLEETLLWATWTTTLGPWCEHTHQEYTPSTKHWNRTFLPGGTSTSKEADSWRKSSWWW